MKCNRSIAVVIIMLFGCFPAIASDLVPPREFLQSIVLVRPGTLDFGELTVEKYVMLIKAASLDNGSYPKVISWTKNKNEYTLRVKFKDQPVSFTFVHDLSARSEGAVSLLLPVNVAGEKVGAFAFSSMLFSLVDKAAFERMQ